VSNLDRSDAISRHETSTRPQSVEALTDVEQRILDFMVQYLRANTYQPSIREIGERFDIKSTKTVSEHLQALADKGRLERDPSRSRGVKILSIDLGADTVSVPCFPGVPADGLPSETDRPDSVVSVDRRMGGEDGCFIVKASAGDLALMGVTEGDLVMVSPTSLDSIGDGTVVLAAIGDDASFHRVVIDGDAALLEALQPGGGATVVGEDADVRLIGRVTGFYRRVDGIGTVNLTQH
jgi:repressor LexA